MTCDECGAGLVKQSTWQHATNEKRADWKAHHCAPIGGRGMCRNCYQRAYRATLGFLRPVEVAHAESVA